jgi:hypothetical protein
MEAGNPNNVECEPTRTQTHLSSLDLLREKAFWAGPAAPAAQKPHFSLTGNGSFAHLGSTGQGLDPMVSAQR